MIYPHNHNQMTPKLHLRVKTTCGWARKSSTSTRSCRRRGCWTNTTRKVGRKTRITMRRSTQDGGKFGVVKSEKGRVDIVNIHNRFEQFMIYTNKTGYI